MTKATQVTLDGEAVEIQWKTPHNHNTRKEALKCALVTTEPTKTQQHARDETDINVIVDRFLKTGTLPQVKIPPSYENFGEIFDFQSALNAVKDATDMFMSMPANIRGRFDNDPAKFVGYVDHCLETGDLDPLRKMGLAVPAKAPELPEEQGTPPAPKEPETLKEPPGGSKT